MATVAMKIIMVINTDKLKGIVNEKNKLNKHSLDAGTKVVVADLVVVIEAVVVEVIGPLFICIILISIFDWVKDLVSTTVGIVIEVVETILVIGIIATLIFLFIRYYNSIIKPTAIFIWQKIIVPVTIYSITKVIIPFIKWLYTRCLKPFTIWLYDLIANLFNKKNHKAKVYHNYQHYREDK